MKPAALKALLRVKDQVGARLTGMRKARVLLCQAFLEQRNFQPHLDFASSSNKESVAPPLLPSTMSNLFLTLLSTHILHLIRLR